MNHTQCRSGADEELSDEQKRTWDQIIEKLLDYFRTDEGTEFYKQFVAVFQKAPQLPMVILTPNETKALHYIRKKQQRGHSPSVREVTRTIGLRSSRSGHKIITSLRSKGII